MSMNNILRLPGVACRHYFGNHCLYEERLNPGYHESFRCTVLQGWEEAFEAFVDRAEAFGLEPSDASLFWRRRLDALLSGSRDCSDFLATDGDGPGCVHFLGGLCVLRLPACAGRCSRFAPEARSSDRERGGSWTPAAKDDADNGDGQGPCA